MFKTLSGRQFRSSSVAPAASFSRICVEDKSMRASGSGTTRASPRRLAGTAGRASASRHIAPKTTFRQSVSASCQRSSCASWSAPKIQKSRARGNAFSKCSAVSSEKLFPPCLSSQSEISNFVRNAFFSEKFCAQERENSSIATRNIARRASAGATGAEFLSGDCAAGTKNRRSSRSAVPAAAASARCAL